MALTLHRSHRLEWLADALAAQLRAHPSPPLVPETVVVQSLGLRKWLGQQLAARLGVAMNIRFPFPATFIAEALGTMARGEEPSPIYQREVLPWRIHAALPELLGEREFAQLRNYAGSEPLRLWQLAGQVAGVFDKYLAYRPEMLIRWEAGDVREGEEWQARLWRTIARGNPHAARILAEHRAKAVAEAQRNRRSEDAWLDDLPLFSMARSAPPVAAEATGRFALFGIGTLPPFHLQVLEALAATADVHLYLLTPTREYWGDIRSEREQARMRKWMAKRGANPEGHAMSEGHPLLASLGKIGREFHEAVLDLTPAEEPDYFDAPDASPPGEQEPSMLGALQESILTLATPETKVAVGAEVRSIQIHNCHSPMRELEVLHDQLLALFSSDPTLEPREVLVAVTNMEIYAPCIEAVFGATETEEVRYPFSIADRAAHAENAVADALLRILELADSRFTATGVLGLLDCAPVRARFGITEAELPLVRDWVTRTGIRWGIDAAHRESMELPGVPEHTWRFGLDRLVLGFALPQEERALFGGILPDADVEGEMATTLGRFAAYCTELFATARGLAEMEGDAAAWTRELRAAVARMCSGDDRLAEQFRGTGEKLDTIEESAALAGHTGTLPFTVIRTHVKGLFADTDSGGGFLRGGITFCSLKPMRAIPHRVIALLGLNDDAFPRATRAPAFDLTAEQPQPGDRTLRDDDRYLFLETLLSARDVLLLSYCGQSPKDNSMRPPSVLVAELLDYLARHFEPAAPHRTIGEQLTSVHRLQAFSADYFRAGGPLFSYSEANALGARRKFLPPEMEVPFACELTPGTVETELSLTALIDALTQPARFFARTRLTLALPFDQEAVEDSEPIVLDARDRSILTGELVAAEIEKSETGALLPPLRASGFLPHGYAGASAFGETEMEARRLAGLVSKNAPGAMLAPAAFSVVANEWTVHCVLGPFTQSARIHLRTAKIRARDELAAWISHLALCAGGPASHPKRTVVVGTDDVLLLPPLPAEAARQELTRLLGIYQQAHSRPLPLFPESSQTYVNYALNLGGTKSKDPLEAARWTWSGNTNARGILECDDRWNALVWRGHLEPLGAEFERIAMQVFEPLVRAFHAGGQELEGSR